MARPGNEARDALLDAAEHVFAVQGIETASLIDDAEFRASVAVQ